MAENQIIEGAVPAADTLAQAPAARGETFASRLRRSFFRNRFAMTGAALLFFFLVCAVFAAWIAPYDPYAQELSARRLPPAWMTEGRPNYILGADVFGRDILSNIIYGIRISMMVGVFAITVSVFLGLLIGLPSGYFGGRLDALLMRAADMQFSIPTLLIVLAMSSILGRGLFKIIIIIGIVGWAEYARTVRGSVISEKEKDYIEAARALGVPDHIIILRHILRNVLTPVIILVIVQMPRVIVLEATLSFLGVGVPPTTPSLGIMIAFGYKYLFSGYWWLTVFPGLTLMLVVLGINLMGDWLRDALDPNIN